MSAAPVDWNQRLLNILVETYPDDARLMAIKLVEGEQQNQAYAERLSAYRNMLEKSSLSFTPK